MTKTEVLEKLAKARSEFLGETAVGPLDLASDLYSCGFDSLSLFNFLLHVEDVFQFKIPDEQFNYSKLSTISDVVDVIVSHGGVSVPAT